MSTRHTQVYLCTRLTGDEDAGRLMSFLVSWSKKAKRTLKGRRGLWNANSRDALMAGAGIKHKKYRRVVKLVAENGIEFVLGKHRGRNAIFSQPKEALLRYLRGDLTLDQTKEILAEGHFRGHFRGHFSITFHSSHTSESKEAPVARDEGRGGQGQDGAVAPPNGYAAPEHQVRLGTSVREDSSDRYLRSRAVAKDADAALVAKIEEAQARLSGPEFRARLLTLMPVIPGPHGIRHPSVLHGERWHDFSAELLVRRYAEYQAIVGRTCKKHNVIAERRRFGAPLAEEDITPAMRAVLDAARATPLKPWRDPEAKERHV
jgi:hypothetical protein